MPIIGDWNDDGKTETGINKDGIWYLDTNSDGAFDARDTLYLFGATDWISGIGYWIGASINSQGITSTNPISTLGNDVIMTIIGTDFQTGFAAQLTKSMDQNP